MSAMQDVRPPSPGFEDELLWSDSEEGEEGEEEEEEVDTAPLWEPGMDVLVPRVPGSLMVTLTLTRLSDCNRNPSPSPTCLPDQVSHLRIELCNFDPLVLD